MEESEWSQPKKRAEFRLLFEDKKTKITSWRFEPGAETGYLNVIRTWRGFSRINSLQCNSRAHV